MGRNIYFLFGWEETHYLHQLSKLLLEFDTVDSVGGIVNHERYYDFLREQDDVDYEVLHCVPHVHRCLEKQPLDRERLDAIEEEFGCPSLWPFLLADRDYVNYDHGRAIRLIQQWFDFYLKVFDDFQPDVYLGYAVAASYTWMPYYLTHELGGTAISWKTLRVGDQYGLMVNDPLDSFPRVHSLFRKFRRGEESLDAYPDARERADQFLAEFREEGTRPGYFSTDDTGRSPLGVARQAVEKPLRLLRYAAMYHVDTDVFGPNYVYGDFRKDSPTQRVKEHLQSAYRRFRVDYADPFESPREDEPFVFFPLHLQPEASTMLLAPLYLDQPSVVQKVAHSLPIEYKLYVKEHPSMIGRRPISYYEQFEDLSNVRLIHPRVDSHRLIQNSDLVTTITGTAGLEALFFKTPALTFGETHYNEMEMVFQSDDPNRLASQIDTAITDYEHDEKELRQYLTAVFERGFQIPGGDFASSAEGATERAQALLPELKPYIEDETAVSVTRE